MDFWMGSRKRDLGLQGILASMTVNGVVDTSGKLRISKEVYLNQNENRDVPAPKRWL